MKILTLNVCGLSRRCKYPEFLEFIQTFDVLCLVETKTDDVDQIDLPEFEIHMKNRFTYRKVRSGGIVLAFKNYLSQDIDLINSESQYVLWFKISKNVLQLNHDVLCGIVYIPPESSKYCIGDPFNELEQEYLNFCGNF